MYRVYHFGQRAKTFTDRDSAVAYIQAQRVPEDWEILDPVDYN